MANQELRRFYVTADKRVVEAGDADADEAVQQIYVEGQEINDAQLNEFGPDVAKELRSKLGRKAVKAVEEPKAVDPATGENKAVGEAPDNKGAGGRS